MRAAERGFLLLSSCLGDPNRKPLTTAQLRTLADRSWELEVEDPAADISAADLMALGYGAAMAQRIVALLSQEEALDYYLRRGAALGCVPLTRVSKGYPLRLRKRLGLDSPGVLWVKGDTDILKMPKIGLVGSRELREANFLFAQKVGQQAAAQGVALVSGNARGADRAAQEACLAAGGYVICVVADELAKKPQRDRILYLSEEDYDAPFTAQRAISRNRVIHALGEKTFVAQCTLGVGGTWDGTVKNLRFSWSDVFCFRDGSEACALLEQMGAVLINPEDLTDFALLKPKQNSFFDQ